MFGNRVNLDEIERMIKTEFGDVDCACVGKDDNMSIYVTYIDEKKQQDIKNFISYKTKLNKAAFKVINVDNIPKNEAGKILYSKLEAK